MKDIKKIHREAMALVKNAAATLQRGDKNGFSAITREALNLEKEAAFELMFDFSSEPTRSVLFRSAATLAYNIGEFAEAEKLVHFALAGNPYPEIKEELDLLYGKIKDAISVKVTKQAAIENYYIEILREKAAYLKVEPKDPKFSKAVVIDYIIDFLKNVQNSFYKYSEINFKRFFNINDFSDFDKSLSAFKQNNKALAVDLKFASFGVSIVADTTIMNFGDFTSDKFRMFKVSLFEDFKKEVLYPDYNSENFQSSVIEKYTPEERSEIYAPMINSLDPKSKYRVSISDKSLNKVVRDIPTINKRTKSILKPVISQPEENERKVLKRTFELVSESGSKGEKLFSDRMNYGEFSIIIKNISYQDKQAYFVNPYELNMVFNYGIFSIDDTHYNIYVENEDYKEVQRFYSKELIEKFSFLLDRESNDINSLSFDELQLLNAMKNEIIKGW